MPGPIIALGGHSPGVNDDALHRYVVRAAATDRPRVCLIPAASGDFEPYIRFFYEQYPASICEPTHLELLRDVPRDPAAVIAEQDIIYVGGGSTPILLGALRVHGLDAALREAWDRGAVLCGDSAGAHIWFDACVTDSFGPELRTFADGLGFLGGAAAAHYGGGARREHLEAALGEQPGARRGWGIDDGTAVLFRGTEEHEIVSSRGTGSAWRLDRQGDTFTHTELVAHRLDPGD